MTTLYGNDAKRFIKMAEENLNKVTKLSTEQAEMAMFFIEKEKKMNRVIREMPK